MMLVRTVAAALLLARGATALAQDELVAQPVPTPSVQLLLDEVPNYAEVLRNQWSAQLPADVLAAETDIEAYGRLLDTEPDQSVSLDECVALALQNNTNLQIQRLTPVSAAAGVRQARAMFDPQLFADINK